MLATALLAGLLCVARADAPVPEAFLKQYRLALLEKVRSVGSYPKEALERNIQGTAVIRLSIGADGRLKASRIETSSGQAFLDASALDMIRTAHPSVAMPEALRGKAFDVAVPVVFAITGDKR